MSYDILGILTDLYVKKIQYKYNGIVQVLFDSFLLDNNLSFAYIIYSVPIRLILVQRCHVGNLPNSAYLSLR